MYSNRKEVDRQLLVDAPLLLAEVKRLRAELEAAEKQIQAMRNCGNCAHEIGGENIGNPISCDVGVDNCSWQST